MKQLKILSLLIFCLQFQFITGQQSINAEKSTINWKGKAAFNSYSPTGTIQVKEGSISIENNVITALNIVIDMTTLDHEIKDLKNHLRNKDFFEVKKYKTATFTLSEPAKIINGGVLVVGAMTIKNTTKKETIKLTVSHEGALRLQFDFNLDRTEYGIKFNSPNFFKKLKENAIADKFNLKGNLVFDR